MQNGKVTVVVTTIAPPNDILREIAQRTQKLGYDFIVVGDEKSPPNFHLEGSDYYDIAKQEASQFKFAKACPKRHYARKNIGYLLAMLKKAPMIMETDDDNLPREDFWKTRARHQDLPTLDQGGWVNIYRYFTDVNIWPRGFALDALHNPVTPWEALKAKKTDCPIHQGLADVSPDVDALYLLTMPTPISFRRDRRMVLGRGSWCPFNSQNTSWWPETYPLLYLPSYSTFRLTDIWRSFVAQRIAWENGWSILFYEPTVEHQRNVHYLLKDFEQEVPGYLNTSKICDALDKLSLKSGQSFMGENLYLCYEKLVSMKILDEKELPLIKLWIDDVNSLRKG